MSFQFASERSKPTERTAIVQAGKTPELKFERLPSEGMWRLTGPSYDFHHNSGEISFSQFSQWLGVAIRRGHFPYGRSMETFRRRANPTESQINQFCIFLNHLAQISENLLPAKPVLRAASPRISAPARLTREMPLVTSMDAFDQIKDRLRQAGEKLDLFSRISIASTPGDSYALEVTIDNHTHSIADAGLGICSVLSCLKTVIGNSDSTALMQQPETRLHPMAQALLSQLIVESKGRYIIETHADHFINRLSICIRKEELSHQDAAIFWFEKRANGVKIHRMDFDEVGNLINAPPNYRAFFIRERKDFLGFA